MTKYKSRKTDNFISPFCILLYHFEPVLTLCTFLQYQSFNLRHFERFSNPMSVYMSSKCSVVFASVLLLCKIIFFFLKNIGHLAHKQFNPQTFFSPTHKCFFGSSNWIKTSSLLFYDFWKMRINSTPCHISGISSL